MTPVSLNKNVILCVEERTNRVKRQMSAPLLAINPALSMVNSLFCWHVDVLQTLQNLRKGAIDAGGAELTWHEFLYFLQSG